MLLLIVLVSFVLSLLACIYEAIAERDWPRDTWPYPIMFLAVLLTLV